MAWNEREKRAWTNMGLSKMQEAIENIPADELQKAFIDMLVTWIDNKLTDSQREAVLALEPTRTLYYEAKGNPYGEEYLS